MSPFRSSSPSLVAFTGLLLLGCTDAPSTAPEAIAPELSLHSQGRSGDAVTVPLKADATFMWIVDTEDFPAECEGTPGLAEGFGSGDATHLGRFEITRLDHCSIDAEAFLAEVGALDPEDPDFDEKFFAILLEHIRREGDFTFTAADGSTISGTYVLFIFAAGPGSTEFGEGAFFSMSITDGTGRFDGATGELEADLERSTLPTNEDALFLEKVAFQSFWKARSQSRDPSRPRIRPARPHGLQPLPFQLLHPCP